MEHTTKHIIAILLENEAGELSRVIGLFSQRSFNIESLTVAPTQDPTLSRITLTTRGNEDTLEQIKKQLNKIVSVFKVIELSEQSHIERELLLLKVRAIGANRDEIKRVTDIFQAKISDITASTYTIELTSKSKTIDAFIRALDTKLILEMVRSGSCGIARGDKPINVK